MKHIITTLFVMLIGLQSALAADFNHSEWNTLLKSHVSVIDNGHSNAVDYEGFAGDRAALDRYLSAVSKVKQQTFNQWPDNDQLAFLINAYNAATVKLILSAWPDIQSIKDLGSFFRSPWSKPLLELLGEKRSLDDIEHGLIRGSGRYADPRIHFAVNCASIGCPALRAEAYDGAKLESQLEQQSDQFLGDPSRNRFRGNTIELSSIFKWYGEDFEKGWKGYHSLNAFLADYADVMAIPPAEISRLKRNEIKLRYLDYNWQLNGIR
jgi:hypothetical protein